MALNDDQIAAKNFKEFYNFIRPFLNPKNAVINNNKFAWRDVYKNDETIVVGQWTDGRPVYQATRVFTSPSTANTWTQVLQLGEGKTIIKAEMHLTLANGIVVPLNWSDVCLVLLNSSGADADEDYEAGSVSMLVKDSSCTECSVFCIVQYTKDSDDGTIELALGITGDYSTSSKIVGSWTDGSAVYQKTYIVNKPLSAVSVWTQNNVAHGLTNVSKVIGLTGTWRDDTNSQYGTIPIVFSNDSLMLYYDSTNIVILYVGAGWSTTVVDSITINYLVADTVESSEEPGE